MAKKDRLGTFGPSAGGPMTASGESALPELESPGRNVAIQEENVALKQQLADLRKRFAPKPEDSQPMSSKRKFRVHLSGVKPLVHHPSKGHEHVDEMEFEATSPGDAFDQFRRYNGILNTTQVPVITEVTAPEPE